MNDQIFKVLCPYQLNWVYGKAPLAIAEKSRRIGWTWCHALRIVMRLAQYPPDSTAAYYHSSADLTASHEFVEDCARWAKMLNVAATDAAYPELIDEEHGISAFVMRFHNGSKIVAGSSNPKFFRSKGGEVGLDEFAHHDDPQALYKAAHAAAAFWQHPLRIWSTHNGENSHFNQLLKLARSGRLQASVHRVTVFDAVEQGIVERIIMRQRNLSDPPKPDPVARQEWLAQLRSTCPDQHTWDEEYMCIPSSEANSLLSYDLIRSCERSPEDLKVVEDPRELTFDRKLYAGMDIGREQDLTVFWVLQKVGDVFETVLVKTFAKTPYQIQEDYLNLLLSLARQGHGCRICIDATGNGMFAERASEYWGAWRAEGVKFTPETKAGLAMPLVRLFEERLVRIPNTTEVREDLHKVRKIVTSSGNIRFDARRDEQGHADRFWALALAYHAADDTKVPLPPPLAEKPFDW